MQRFRGGLVFKAQRLCVSLNSRLESNEEEATVRVWSLPSTKNTLKRLTGILGEAGRWDL